MTEDQDGKDTQSDSGIKTYINKSKDKKTRTQRPLTKIILRRLPPNMTEEGFLEQVSPIPDHDHFYFAKPDLSLGNNVYSRAYINFVNVEDIFIFRDKFDGYVFLDDKGVEYVGIVEYAPYQRIPKKKKKRDPKCGTIESDPLYQEFVESLNKDQEMDSQPKLEYSYPVNDGNEKKVQSTPLLEYLSARKHEKRGRDERRRRENDKRKMRIERKTKDGPIKRMCHGSEDETVDNLNNKRFWNGEQRVYHKSKARPNINEFELKCAHGSDELLCTDSDWNTHFPALSTKTHNTFTLTSTKFCDKNVFKDGSQNSGGDTHAKEEESGENEVKKIKPREWDREKPSSKSNQGKSDKDVYESKSYKDQRKTSANVIASDKKKKIDVDIDTKEEDDEDGYKSYKKDKRDKLLESPREQKSKKYSENRKDRLKQSDNIKSDKQSVINKMMSAEGKIKINHDDIKPFTQLPQVRTDDLTKIMESLDKKVKHDDENVESCSRNNSKHSDKDLKSEEKVAATKIRRSSIDSGDLSNSEDYCATKQTSYDDRSKSTDREGSEEKDKSDSDRRTERRIRNKDRPSLVIYQPGMGKFSKQRLAKEKDVQPHTATKSLNCNEKKDT